MSESSVPLIPSNSADVPTRGLLTQTQSSSRLCDFPPDATFRIWRKPNEKDRVEPIDGGAMSASELIPEKGSYILICFTTMATDDWNEIRAELSVGLGLDLHPLLVGAVDRTHIASGLYGAGDLAGQHGLTQEPSRGTIFVPSHTLMRLLKIQRINRSRSLGGRNALILIRNGRICAEWISGGDDGNWRHDWIAILPMVRH